MKLLQIATLAAAASIMLPAAAEAGQTAGAAEACPPVAVAEIERQFARLSEAWASRDPDKVTALFTAEPVLLATVSNQPRTSPALVRDYFASFLQNKPVARIDTSTISIDCHTASRVGTWTVTLTDPVTGAMRDVAARYSLIYRFEGDEWKIDHLHSSMMPEASPSASPSGH